METLPNDEYEETTCDHEARQTELDNLHFAHVYALSLLAHNVIPDEKLCSQWIKEGFVNAVEMEQIIQAYEELKYG